MEQRNDTVDKPNEEMGNSEDTISTSLKEWEPHHQNRQRPPLNSKYPMVAFYDSSKAASIFCPDKCKEGPAMFYCVLHLTFCRTAQLLYGRNITQNYRTIFPTPVLLGFNILIKLTVVECIKFILLNCTVTDIGLFIVDKQIQSCNAYKIIINKANYITNITWLLRYI